MKRNTYFLILFTLFAQFDDALLSFAATSLSAPLTSDDDDECLPLLRLAGQEQCSRRLPRSISVKLLAGSFSPFGRSLLAEPILTTPFAPPPLYLFSSLQI
jgi:hypothetical protein